MSVTLFYHANFILSDDDFDAILVENGKIVTVGKSTDLLTDKRITKKVDVKWQAVLPGFNDAHIHVWKVGNLKTFMLDLRGTKSITEIQSLLVEYDNKLPKNQWLVARGFNEADLIEGRLLDKNDLDKAVENRPLFVIRTCAHIAVANSCAMRLANISKHTQAPSGGEIVLDKDGNPTGVFLETALGLVQNHIPPYDEKAYKTMILAAQQAFFKYGITSATDPAVHIALLQVYHQMNQEGSLQFRLNAIPIMLPDGATEALPLVSKFESDYLKIDTVKFFADGGLSGQTAAMKTAYKNSNNKGVLRLEANMYYKMALNAAQNGFKIATHAIGDLAVEMVLNVYQKIRLNSDVSLRHRIEHLGYLSPDEAQMMKKNKISAVMQPIFIYELAKNFKSHLEQGYLQRTYPFRTVLSSQIPLSFSSDAPVVNNYNPFRGIYTAVTRQDDTNDVIGANEAISLKDALLAYTLGSAYVNNDETNRGSISVGKWADFIVLNQNPFEVAEQDIPFIEVLQTYVGGNLKYSKDG